jgi:knotted carbamoyltransferase YgeW
MENLIQKIKKLNTKLYNNDFLLTWDKSQDEIKQVVYIAELLKMMREKNISPRCFDSGLAVSMFRDQSTRTRFSFSSAANLLGLEVQDFDESKSQVGHGETARETANMISFLTDVIGIRDDLYMGHGHKYMLEIASALDDGFKNGVLPQRPGIVNLQCDIDHPTQSLADLMHLKQFFGSLENLKGKKIAMTWAYSPSYGKPLSVPQGIIGLMTRFGMDVKLAYPKGYELMPEVISVATEQSNKSGGSFEILDTMDEAFVDADIIYPKSWAPFSIMEERAELYAKGDDDGLKALEQKGLKMNEAFSDWECDEEKMKLTKAGKALYMHCLPADITGVSCQKGEVQKEVFEKYRLDTYREAAYKPYVIASMILNNKYKDPAKLLAGIILDNPIRVL